jgi:DNA-binding transcriptional ArsR family regulator
VAPLFRSDGQARLLAELFLSGADELNLNELATRVGLAYGTVHREVRRLLEAGLLSERRVGQARLVRPNPGSPLTQPVRDLLLVSAGPVPLLAAELRDISGVQAAFLYGSFAARMRGEPGNAPNDIDVMVVGSPDPMAVYEACRRVGDQVGREVNATIMTPDEIQEHSGFLAQVRRSATVPIIGDLPWQ